MRVPEVDRALHMRTRVLFSRVCVCLCVCVCVCLCVSVYLRMAMNAGRGRLTLVNHPICYTMVVSITFSARTSLAAAASGASCVCVCVCVDGPKKPHLQEVRRRDIPCMSTVSTLDLGAGESRSIIIRR